MNVQKIGQNIGMKEVGVLVGKQRERKGKGKAKACGVKKSLAVCYFDSLINYV